MAVNSCLVQGPDGVVVVDAQLAVVDAVLAAADLDEESRRAAAVVLVQLSIEPALAAVRDAA